MIKNAFQKKIRMTLFGVVEDFDVRDEIMNVCIKNEMNGGSTFDVAKNKCNAITSPEKHSSPSGSILPTLIVISIFLLVGGILAYNYFLKGSQITGAALPPAIQEAVEKVTAEKTAEAAKTTTTGTPTAASSPPPSTAGVSATAEGKVTGCFVAVTKYSIGSQRLCPYSNKGVCGAAYTTCTETGWTGCDYNQFPHYEKAEKTCDFLDNDCDGLTDEGC